MKNPPSKLLAAATTAALLTTVPAVTAVAEEVRVPVMSQAERSEAGNLPDRGQSQASVESEFGAPVEIEGPVGEPPITQWHYQGFVVYFESGRVLHTVLKPAS